MSEITKQQIIAAAHELSADNRHTSSFWAVARAYGYRDLQREFAAIYAEHKRTGDVSDELNGRRRAAYKQLRQRIIEEAGESEWLKALP